MACGASDALALYGVISPMDILLGVYLIPSEGLSTLGVSKTTEDKISTFEKFIIFSGQQDVLM